MSEADIVFTRIKEAEKSFSKTLDLSNLNLQSFPTEILALKDHLELLNLGGNKISALPKDISCMTNLKILFFAGNSFKQIPKVLGTMNSLRMLSFKSNEVETIEEESLNLNLKWLILTDNKIKSLPESIGRLKSLRKLMLAGNKLKRLPIELSDCRELELIRLAANELEELPDWLLTLPRLSWLAVAGNPCVDGISPPASCLSIDQQNIQMGEKLGEGASGVVYKAILNQNDIMGISDTVSVAVKLFRAAATSDGLPEDEMKAASAIGRHSNIQQVLGQIGRGKVAIEDDSRTKQQPGLVFTLIDPAYSVLGGPPSFDSITRDTYPAQTTFPLPYLLEVARGIASAGAHLVTLGIMHGDLYAHNILVNRSGHAILGDFGAASFYRPGSSGDAELFQRIEVRAFGCLLEELVDRADDSDTSRPILQLLRNITYRCLDEDVRSRPTFAVISEQLDKLATSVALNRSSLSRNFSLPYERTIATAVAIIIVMTFFSVTFIRNYKNT